MKVLVLIWGWIVFTPILAPIFALPLLVLVGKVLRFALRRVSIAIIFVALSLALGAITYLNAQYGLQYYFDFLGKKGAEANGVVVNVLKESNLLGNESKIVVTIQFQNSFGETQNIAVSLNEPRLYPHGAKLNFLPELGDSVQIRYFPQVETGLMIDTDPNRSAVGKKVQCLQLNSELKIAQIRYSYETPAGRIETDAYKVAIQALLDSPCLSLADRNHYRGILSGLN